jgi:hypothetical protein
MWENVFLLVLTGVVKVGFTAWTFGMMVELSHDSDETIMIGRLRSQLEYSCQQLR